MFLVASLPSVLALLRSLYTHFILTRRFAPRLALRSSQQTVKESTARSAVKSMSWRVIAGTVTLITSLKYSGSLKTALTIVGSDFFSKAATMFIGERMMNQSQAGRTKDSDGVGRSLTKVRPPYHKEASCMKPKITYTSLLKLHIHPRSARLLRSVAPVVRVVTTP